MQQKNCKTSNAIYSDVINRKEIGKKPCKIHFTSKTILQGIVFSEILSKPKGRKGKVTNYEYKGFNSR